MIFVRVGGETNTVAGVFVSFVPSAILGIITWAAKKHLFKELEEEEEEAEDKNEENRGKEKPLFQIGGLSYHPRQRRYSRTRRRRISAADSDLESRHSAMITIHEQPS